MPNALGTVIEPASDVALQTILNNSVIRSMPPAPINGMLRVNQYVINEPPPPVRVAPGIELPAHEAAALPRMEVPGWGEVIKIPHGRCRACGATLNYYATTDGQYVRDSDCERCIIQRATGTGNEIGWGVLGNKRDRVATEYEGFRAQFPNVARVLEPQIATDLATHPGRITGHVDPGQVVYDTRPTRFGPMAPTVAQHETYLRRFVAGEFGQVGRLDDVVITEPHRFAPELAPVLVRNALALEAGFGTVLAAYEDGYLIVMFLGEGRRTMLLPGYHDGVRALGKIDLVPFSPSPG